MKLGLIGMPLGHSWSPAIHNWLIGEDYRLIPLEKDELGPFLEKRNFDGINVTIPYKQDVIPYLDEIDENAEKIGAINCIINNNGRLKGYNTDFEGFRDMLVYNNISVKGIRTAVLGTGGASKAVVNAIESFGGYAVTVSRSDKPGSITYEHLYETQSEYGVIVNATPVGMAPDTDRSPIDLSRFTCLQAVVDIIANPLCTKLCFQAKQLGIPHLGGFEMLVRQAIAADRYFLNKDMDADRCRPCMDALLEDRRNIVLIGMPTCGKSTLASLLAQATGKAVVEMDQEITDRIGMSISDWFALHGEGSFRQIETETAIAHSEGKGEIISCGGGVIKTEATMQALSRNGIIVWIDRDLSLLYSSSDRPLASNIEQVKQLYEQRRPLYRMYSDIIVENNGTVEQCIDAIIEKTGLRRQKK